MLLPDVNVLVYAYRRENPRHHEFRSWLDGILNGDQAYGMSGLVLSGFVRIVTHPRVFLHPEPVESALAFAEQLLRPPHCVRISPGPRHWDIFRDLCTRVQAKGNMVPDAFFAALAIENGCEWITTDQDYSRFPGLNWRHPLAEQ